MVAFVRQLYSDDLDAVAAVHGAAFPNSALTRMGARTVWLYYDWQLNGPHDSLAVGAFLGDEGNAELTGFCFAGTFNGSLSGFLARHRVILMLSIARRPHLVADPEIRSRIRTAVRVLWSRILRAKRRRATAKPRSSLPRSFGVLAIAVHPAHQGSGHADQLLEAAEATARRQSFERMHLSVRADNSRAISFYRRHGWSVAPTDAGQTVTMQKGLTG